MAFSCKAEECTKFASNAALVIPFIYSKEVCNNTSRRSPVNIMLIFDESKGQLTVDVAPGMICRLTSWPLTAIFMVRGSLAGFQTMVEAVVFPGGMLHQNIPCPMLFFVLSGSGILPKSRRW